MTIRTRLAPLIVLASLACAPAPRAGDQLPSNGATAPPELAGAWTITFTLDSQLASDARDPVIRWRRNRDTVAASGTLTLGEPRGDRVRGTMSVDFTGLLGRQMSCYQPGKVELQVEPSDDRLLMAFTPGAADCGFGANVRWMQDSVAGVWSETSFVGPIAVGRVRMTRRIRKP